MRATGRRIVHRRLEVIVAVGCLALAQQAGAFTFSDGTSAGCIARGEDRVDVLAARFRRRRHHGRDELAPRRDGDTHTAIECVFAEHLRPWEGDHCRFHGAGPRIERQRRAPHEDDWPDVATREVIRLDGLTDRCSHRGACERDLDPVDAGRCE